MKLLRVCFLVPDFSDGGAQKQYIYLLNELQRDSSIDVTLVHFHSGVHHNLLETSGLRVIKLSVKSNYDVRNILKVRAVVREVRPDILLTWLHSCDVLGFFARRVVPRMRWVMTERDSAYRLNDPRYALRWLLGRFADLIVANSDRGRSYWKRAGARCPLVVIPNIVHQRSGGEAAPTGSPKRVVTIGRLEAQKNIDTVVAAFCRLAAARSDVQFAVIGAGSLAPALKAAVEKQNLADRIAFLGFREDIPEQIRASDVVVSMSHHEGLPNVMLESVAGRRLVVASDIPEHRSLLGDEYPYYVQDREDEVAVAKMIEVALANAINAEPLEYARGQLNGMSPDVVVSAYRRLFITLKGRSL